MFQNKMTFKKFTSFMIVAYYLQNESLYSLNTPCIYNYGQHALILWLSCMRNLLKAFTLQLAYHIDAYSHAI